MHFYCIYYSSNPPPDELRLVVTDNGNDKCFGELFLEQLSEIIKSIL